MANHDPIYMMTLKTKYKTKTTCVICLVWNIDTNILTEDSLY